MESSRRLILVLTGIAVALILVIGGLSVAMLTGGDENGGGSQEEQGEEGPELPERVQGELRLFGPDPIILDPACVSDAASAEYIVEIFSGLVTIDRETYEPVPDIAERWEVSDDGTVYTFYLRHGVLFHDGSRQVTADDFKFSMERALNPRTLSTVGLVYLGDIVGAKEYASGQADEVRGIKVIDPYTLEITLDAPKPYFLSKLTYPTAFVVDQREVGDATCFEGVGWTRNPNGTGPFKLAKWELGQTIELVPNENYYLEPKPSLAKVTYILGGGSSMVMYETGEIDLTGVGINDIERVRDPNDPLNKEFVEGPSLDTFYVGFNTQEPPFDDPRVRRAFAMAVDKDILVKTVLKDLAIRADGILPPGMPGYNQNLEGLPFDPQAARDLLEEVGGPGALGDITLLTSGQGATPGPVLEALVAMWEENLGVTVRIEQEDFAQFLIDLDQGRAQMFSLGWIADYVDPQNFLEIKFHSQSPNNETRYSNPEVDRLLDQAATEQDQEKRLRLYQQAEEIIVQDAPWIPLYHGKVSALVKPYVKGYQVPPFVFPNLRYLSIQR